MDKKILSKVIKDLNQGKAKGDSLNQFKAYAMKHYQAYSSVKMVMNLYTLQEILSEDVHDTKHIQEDAKKLWPIIDKYLEEQENTSYEELIQRLASLRNEIMDKTKVLTVYTDVLEIYEHIINRIEFHFAEDPLDDIQMFTAEVMEQLLSEQDDHLSMNYKLQEIIRQLPVRMTKQKFYDRLRDSFSIYIGSPESTFNDFIEMLRGSSLLEEPNGYGEFFKEVYDVILLVSKENYTFVQEDKNRYLELSKKIEETAIIIQYLVYQYLLFMEIVNDLYACLLTKPYLEDVDKKVEIAQAIIKEISHISPQNFLEKEDHWFESLRELEGYQEDLLEHFSSIEGTLSYIEETYSQKIEEEGLQKEYDALGKLKLLVSNSLFVDLDRPAEASIDLEPKRMEEIGNSFITDLDNLFKQNTSRVNRAVMAALLSKVAIFFNNGDEIYDYIQSSLDQCRDVGEKRAAMYFIKELMEEV